LEHKLCRYNGIGLGLCPCRKNECLHEGDRSHEVHAVSNAELPAARREPSICSNANTIRAMLWQYLSLQVHSPGRSQSSEGIYKRQSTPSAGQDGGMKALESAGKRVKSKR
jgi:hypothetical protein